MRNDHLPSRAIRGNSTRVTSTPFLELLASSSLPTRRGVVQLNVYGWNDPDAHPALSKEHCAMVWGQVRGKYAVPVRLHSECLTSEVFGSLKCDCREQFDFAQAELERRGFGILVYLRQEGRGIGLSNKIRAYALQERGADTIEANELLRLPVDARRYDVAAAILRDLEVRSVELLTNNPEKVDALSKLGIEVEKRIPVHVPPNPFSAAYLEAKRTRMRHQLPGPYAEKGNSVSPRSDNRWANGARDDVD